MLHVHRQWRRIRCHNNLVKLVLIDAVSIQVLMIICFFLHEVAIT